VEALRSLRGEILRSSSARILEEFYKILRQGRSRRTFEMLHEHGLLAYILPEADHAISRSKEALLGSLGRLDAHRRAGLATPDQLTNPLLVGSLLVPLGVPLRRVAAAAPPPRRARPEERSDPEPPRDDVAAEVAALGAEEDEAAAGADPGPAGPLSLPFARRDLERLRLIQLAQRRLREGPESAPARRAMVGKSYFEEAVRWLAIQGGEEERALAAQWSALGPAEPGADDEPSPEPATGAAAGAREADASRRRRRRRRRRPPSEPDAPA